jgi:hypothetical protein
MWQVATPASVFKSRKLAHPLVPQKSRLARAWLERRRSRRMDEARPVTDAVAVRVIMGFWFCAFWRAVIAVSCDRLRGRCRRRVLVAPVTLML